MATKQDTAAQEPVDLGALNRQVGLLKLSIEGLQAKAKGMQIEPEDIHPMWDLVSTIQDVVSALPGAPKLAAMTAKPTSGLTITEIDAITLEVAHSKALTNVLW